MLSPPVADTAAQELEVWAELEQIHAAVARALDRALEREHGLSLHGFELLDALASAPAQRRRMSELATEIPLTASGITRLVARLERYGLVARVHCPEDGRVTYAHLTDAGRTKLQGAAETHGEAVRDLLRGRFSEETLCELRRLLNGAHVRPLAETVPAAKVAARPL